MADFISITEAAEILGVDRSTVFRWVQAGRLKPATLVGRRPLFERGYILREAEKLSGEKPGPQPADSVA